MGERGIKESLITLFLFLYQLTKSLLYYSIPSDSNRSIVSLELELYCISSPSTGRSIRASFRRQYEGISHAQ